MNWWEESAASHTGDYPAAKRSPQRGPVNKSYYDFTHEEILKIKFCKLTGLSELAKKLGVTYESVIEARWQRREHPRR